MKFTDVYAQFLSTLKSNSLAELSDEDIISYLDDLMIRAIADFSFPYKSLAFETTADGYVFTGDITQREINVLIVMIKSFWLEKQLDDDNMFGVTYYDKDVKTFSTGNKIKAMQSRYVLSKIEIRDSLSNYYAEDDGNVAIESIYG